MIDLPEWKINDCIYLGRLPSDTHTHTDRRGKCQMNQCEKVTFLDTLEGEIEHTTVLIAEDMGIIPLLHASISSLLTK